MANQTIKKELSLGNMKVQLFKIDPLKVGPNGVSNMNAVDSDDKILWRAEAPRSNYEAYHDIDIDVVTQQLIAVTGSGYHHLIDINTGKVLRHYLVK